jgi:hypothetical protein
MNIGPSRIAEGQFPQQWRTSIKELNLIGMGHWGSLQGWNPVIAVKKLLRSGSDVKNFSADVFTK